MLGCDSSTVVFASSTNLRTKGVVGRELGTDLPDDELFLEAARPRSVRRTPLPCPHGRGSLSALLSKICGNKRAPVASVHDNWSFAALVTPSSNPLSRPYMAESDSENPALGLHRRATERRLTVTLTAPSPRSPTFTRPLRPRAALGGGVVDRNEQVARRARHGELGPHGRPGARTGRADRPCAELERGSDEPGVSPEMTTSP